MGEKKESDHDIILPEDIDLQALENQVIVVKETNILQDVVINFKNAGNEVLRRHKQGSLPIQIFAFVVVYNFILFESQEGKELYVLLPLIFAGLTYWLKYWENPIGISYYVSSFSLFAGLIMDLLVSISHIPTYTNWGYSLESIPTLVADLIALFSAILWFINDKEISVVNIEIQS